MKMSFYNIYLLITKDGGENFSIVELKTNNIINIRIEAFINKEEIRIIEARFKTKYIQNSRLVYQEILMSVI